MLFMIGFRSVSVLTPRLKNRQTKNPTHMSLPGTWWLSFTPCSWVVGSLIKDGCRAIARRGAPMDGMHAEAPLVIDGEVSHTSYNARRGTFAFSWQGQSHILLCMRRHLWFLWQGQSHVLKCTQRHLWFFMARSITRFIMHAEALMVFMARSVTRLIMHAEATLVFHGKVNHTFYNACGGT